MSRQPVAYAPLRRRRGDRGQSWRCCGVPALIFALGMYLPLELNTPALVGGFLVALRHQALRARRRGGTATMRERGVIIASGLMAGGALGGVFGAALRLFPWYREDLIKTPFFANEPVSQTVSVLGFIAFCVYLWMKATRTPNGGEMPRYDNAMTTSVLERFLRYVTYDTQSREGADTYPSTPGQLVLLRDLVGELQQLGLDGCRDRRARLRHGHDPGDDRARPACPTIGFIAHVDTSPEMSGADVRPIVHRQLRRPRPGAARRSDARCCGWPTSPYLAEQHRPRHRHGVGHDAARRRQQGRRRRDRDRGRISRRASGDPARRRPHRVHAGRRGRRAARSTST